MSSASSPSFPRVASIDAFRGFVIATMVFVNHIAWFPDIPGWMRHVPVEENGMTFVDVVFPAFLFIVGMVIPIALERRIRQTGSVAKSIGHVFMRFAGLVAIGLLMVNSHGLSAEKTGMSDHLWTLLMYLCVVLVWTAYPKEWKPGWALRALGALGLLTLIAIYRTADDGWMRTQWWGILGLIGWAYLAACIVFFIVRRSTTGLLAAMALFIAYYIAGVQKGLSPFMDPIDAWINSPAFIGSHTSMVIAGMIAGVWASSDIPQWQKLRNFLAFGAALLVAGYLFTPLHGFHKNNATESWALASAGWALLVYALFYFLMDMKGIRGWSIIFQPAGKNPLLAYILPGIISAAFFVIGFNIHETFNHGNIAILHGVIFSAIIIAITAGANKVGILLRF